MATRIRFKKSFINYKYVKILLLLCHILLALDFGYMKRPTAKLKRVIKFFTLLYSIFLSLIIGYFYYLIVDDGVLLAYLLVITLHSGLNALSLVLYGFSGSFYKLQKSLMSIDSKLYVNSESHGIDKFLIIFFIICLLFRFIINYVFCMKYNNECINSEWGDWGLLIYILQQLVFDIVIIVFTFMFYCVYCRLKVLNDLVKNSGKQVIQYLLIYKNIVNVLYRSKRPFDVLYSFALIFKMPELVVTAYVSLLKIKINYEHDEAHNHFLRNLYTIVTFVLLALPAVTAGLVTAAATELRLIIYDRLLLERDENYVADLELLLSYVEVRPMQFTVFEIVPLDWSLPVLIVDVCISYQIIVVQITNLY